MAERILVFGINDIDETLPGPWEWALKRLTTIINNNALADAAKKSRINIAELE